MAQHPMTKAYIKAFKKAGGKEWAQRFNPFSLDQTFRFGYRVLRFRVQSVGTVASYEQDLIPSGAVRGNDVVMIPDAGNALGGWLREDWAAKCEFERFAAVVAKTYAEIDW